MKKEDEKQYDLHEFQKTEKLVRGVLIIAGTIFVGLGILGIVLPLLPTTPFLLLALACYTRSSQRLYNWILNNKLFGDYIENYIKRKGIPLKIKMVSISLLWTTILISAIFFVHFFFIRIMLILIAVAVTIHILKIQTLDTIKKDEPDI
jgi:hypothetical protein